MNATNNSSAINLLQDEPLETVDPLLSKKIVSVNAKGAESGNKVAKSLFIIACLAILIGALAFFGQNFINSKKAAAKEGKSKADQADLLNPERTVLTKAQVGAASGKPPPAEPTAPIASPGFQPQKGIRPIRGADGKVMLNAQGKPMGVDENGNVVDVPGIDVQVNEPPKKALPTNAANSAKSTTIPTSP
jgi:type IV secretion system protein VirB10